MYAKKEKNKVKKYDKLPKVWEKENGQIIVNFENASKEVYNEEGFYDIEKPIYNEVTQRLGKLKINKTKKIAKYVIVNKTELEIDKENNRFEDAKIEEKKNFGLNYYNKNKRRLKRKLKKGNLTQVQFDKLYTPTRKALIWCNTGDFDLALLEVQKLNFDNDKLQRFIDTIIQDLEEFLTD